MNNQFLIPANSKKSKLILGFFTITDLIVCGVGATMTLILVLLIKNPKVWQIVLCISPVATATLLVMPVRYYHNVLQLLTNIFNFFIGRRKYYWKGWCVRDEFEQQ